MTDKGQPGEKKQKKRRSRLFGCVVGGGILFLLGVSIVAIGLAAYGSWLNWRIAELEQHVRDKEQPVTLEELEATYPQVPDDDNAALDYLKAQALIETIDPKMERSIAFGKAAQSLGTKGPLQESFSKSIKWQVRDLEPVFALLDTAAGKEHARFSFDFRLVANAWPAHLAATRNLAQVEFLRLVAALEDKDFNQVLLSQRSTLAMAEALRLEPLGMSQLVRNSILGISVSSLKYCLCQDSLPEDSMHSLVSLYASLEDNDAIIRTFVSDRCLQLFMIQSVLESDNTVEGTPLQRTGERVFPNYYRFQVLFASRINRMNLLTQFEPLVALDKVEWPDRIVFWSRNRPAEENTSLLDMAGNLKPTNYLAIPMYGRTLALTRMARSALAIELYRSANGNLPPSLDQLVPTYLPEIPVDPFDGNALRYTRLPEGYRLYSIYADLKDDGGREADLSEGLSYDGDVVFEVRR